jgi:hypothetical protein
MPKKVSVYLTKFTVTGKLPFPIDMLRYDSCFPYSGEDAGKIMATLDHLRGTKRETYHINLIKVDHNGNGPEMSRWSSFLWSVDRDSIVIGGA